MFTSVALFNILISPLNAFPWVINGLMEAWVSTKRVQQFLQLDELDWSTYYHLQCNNGRRLFEDDNNLSATKVNNDIGAPCGSNDGGEIGGDSGESSVCIRDGCFTWKREGSSASKCDSAQTGKAGETGSSSQQEGLEEPTAWMLVDLNLSIRPVSAFNYPCSWGIKQLHTFHGTSK